MKIVSLGISFVEGSPPNSRKNMKNEEVHKEAARKMVFSALISSSTLSLSPPISFLYDSIFHGCALLA